MTPDPILDRFWKLVRLATNNPNAEEARSAALKAVQVLVEQKLVVSLLQQTPTRPPLPTSIDDLMRQARESMDKERYRRESQRRWYYNPATEEYIDPASGERETSADRAARGGPR